MGGVKEGETRNPREILIMQGVPADAIDEGVVMFAKVSTPDQLRAALRRGNFTCDIDQFLLPFFRPLYTEVPEIQEEILSQLGERGVDRDFAHIYLTDMGDQPYVLMSDGPIAAYGLPTMKTLINTSRELMLSILRRQFNISPTPSSEKL